MKKKKIIKCLVLMGIIGCIVAGCASSNMRKKEEQARREEIIAGYPDEIKAYLKEKYGREFCVASKPISGTGSPIPFMHSDYVTYQYLAWENEEDGYAFWTEVYPMSLEDKEIREIRDNYSWKFISGKIKEELEARLEGIIDECKIIARPFGDMMFGEKTNTDSGIKEALLDSESSASTIDIWVYVLPEIRFDEDGSLPEIEKIVEGFYNDYFPVNSHSLDFYIQETYTEEDYLKIEPEKSEQYLMHVKESEYEDGAKVPVSSKRIVNISIIRGERK